jgi:hypothetical protein
MGYCYNNEAGRVMDRIDKAIRAQGGESSNVYHDGKGTRYFYEVARKDQPDGGLRGTIHKMLPENMAVRVGRFAISGDGKRITAPAHFKALAH